MNWYWSPAGVLMAAVTPLLMGLAWAAWRRRPSTAASSLTLVLVSAAWWTFAYALELSAASEYTVTFWGDIKFLGILLLPPAWLVFALAQTQREERITPRLLAALGVMPVVVTVLLSNGATHHLIRSYPDLQLGDLLPLAEPGPLFWVHAVYSYGLLLTGAGLLIATWLRSSRHYRIQAVVIAVAALVCLVGNVMHLGAVEPFARLDPTPFTVLVMGGLLVWGVLLHGLLPLGPIARHQVLERMSDAVVVLDAARNVVDLNPAARELFGRPGGATVGQPAERVLPPEATSAIPEDPVDGQTELTLRVDGHDRDFDLAWSILRDSAGRTGGHVLVLRDISARKRAEARLAHAAHYDPLTGLPNRKLLSERLDELLAKGQRFAVLFCDLDRFKRINDTLGHDLGDAVLRQVAERLVEAVGEGDTVARLGGDEFVVVAVDRHGRSRDTVAAGRRLVAAIARPIGAGSQEVYLTASIGIARSPEHGEAAAALLQSADRAMYRAKARGRNRVEVSREAWHDRSGGILQLERDLHALADNGQLELRYQPITSLVEERCLGMEALLRWRHPERGLLRPQDFMAVAEQTDLIHKLGRRVLEDACTQAVEWRRHHHLEPFSLAVNLSARQFRPALPKEVARVLERTGLEPARLTLEITETVVLQEGPETLRILHALKNLGVQIATDDFGTGYTSLKQLRLYPLDVVKVDRSFVRGMVHRQEDELIVAAMISLAHDLGLRVVAEGVETEQQARMLRGFACDAAQGFLFAHPLTAADADAYLYADEERAAVGILGSSAAGA